LILHGALVGAGSLGLQENFPWATSLTWPTAPRPRSFPGFSIQLGANGSISPLLSTAGEVLAPADSAFGLTLTVQEISMQRKFERGASKMQAHGNISLLLLMSLSKTLSVVIYQSSSAY
jgi:hypothetical protein